MVLRRVMTLEWVWWEWWEEFRHREGWLSIPIRPMLCQSKWPHNYHKQLEMTHPFNLWSGKYKGLLSSFASTAVTRCDFIKGEEIAPWSKLTQSQMWRNLSNICNFMEGEDTSGDLAVNRWLICVTLPNTWNMRRGGPTKRSSESAREGVIEA